MSEKRGPAHCPECAVIEPAGGFDRDDHIGAASIAQFRCLDCGARFAWRCFPTDPECSHGPFQYTGERFVFYFGQGTRPESSRLASSDRIDRPTATDADNHEAYQAPLKIASYEALDEFLDTTSDALIDSGETTTIRSMLEDAGGEIEWPCEIIFHFDAGEWTTYSATRPNEATVLEPHLIVVAE